MMDDARAEAQREASAARAALRQATIDLALLPARVDRAPIAALIERAAAALDALAACAPDDPAHLDHVAVARASTDGARALLTLAGASGGAIEGLRSVRASLAAYEERAIDRLAAAPARKADRPEAAPPARPFRASVGVPSLHRVVHAPISTPIRVAAADDDDPQPEKARDRSDPQRAELRRVARDALEEIGALGELRRAEGEAPWSRALARFEQRMLNDLDAIAALGRGAIRLDVPREVLGYAGDAFVPDTIRPFARALVLGCLEGDDLARAAALALRASHPYSHDAQRAALSLASSPAIDEEMRGLSRHDDPALAALALDVLRARGAEIFDVAAALIAHPDPRVRRRAALGLGRASRAERPAAIELLERRLRDERDDEAAVAAMESLATLDTARAQGPLRERASAGAHHGWTRLLALAGGRDDAARLAARLDGSPEAAFALGVHGHPGHVGVLIDALDRAVDDPGRASLARALAGAIRRITGDVVTPDRGGVAAARALSAERGERFDPEKRYRFGAPYTPIASLDELSADGVPGRTREALALEIAIAIGAAPRLDVHGWVAAQLADIARIRDLVARLDPPHPPGAWPSRRRDR